MKTIFLVVAAIFLGTAGVLTYDQYKKGRFDTKSFYVGLLSFIGFFYLFAKPLLPGKTYQMTNNGLVEVLPPQPNPPL